MNPTVSFILPVYNVAPYLPRCLDSILMQSLENYEVLLVNNGSYDDSLAVCQRYAEAHGNFRVLDLGQSGVSAARNAGLAAAHGEYVCFLDADDFYTADFAAAFYDTCRENRLDIIRGQYRFYDDASDTFRRSSVKARSYDGCVLSGTEFLTRSLDEFHEVVPWLGFFRREFLAAYGAEFPTGIGYEEDHLFFLQALLHTPCRAMQTDAEFYAYRMRGGSATKSPSMKQAQDVSEIVTRELKLAEAVSDPRVRDAVRRYAGSSFFHLTCIYGRLPRAQRRRARRLCRFRDRLICSQHAANRYQQYKNALFTLCPLAVDAMYAIRKIQNTI